MTPELAEYLVTIPGRCPVCLADPQRQGGHVRGCTAPPNVSPPPPQPRALPPLAWTLGLSCEHWDGTAVCGATGGVRHYLSGPCCPAHTPEAIRRTT